jgi:Protein of unknown function (DUF3078)
MKKIALLSALSLLGAAGYAQVTKTDDVKKSLATTNKDTVAWVRSGIFTIGINQGLLHNWAAGGELASLDINAVFHGNLTYYNHGTVWANNLELAYGLHYSYADTFLPHKTADRIDFTSNYGAQIKNSKDFYLAGLFNFKSQFTHGYDYSIPNWQSSPTSDFLSPAYITLAAGVEYKKGEELNLFLSPAAAREILADRKYTSASAQGAFGIDSGKTSKLQFGAYFSGRFKRNLSKTTLFTSRLDLYSNYLAKNTTDAAGNIVKKDNPGNIQIFWDNLLAIKAYKSLSVTLGLTFAYDNNFPYSKTYVDKSGNTVTKSQPLEDLGWVQLNEIFTFGLAYKF